MDTGGTNVKKIVAIIGAGMMGQGIKRVLENTCTVIMYDSRPNIEGTVATIKEAVENADFVIEAVFEDMQLKQNIFAEIEPLTKAILCTNTSVMSISQIASKLIDKSRLVGTHFWNPADLIPLVEVVKGDETSDDVIKYTMELLTECGKKPILCKKDVPGFVANRLQHALWREAFYMVQEGIADAKTVDDACKYGPGLRWSVLGPLENSDMVGIQLTYNIHDYILKSLADNHEPSPMLKEMLEHGELGFMSGKGWQEWTETEIEASKSNLREYLVKQRELGGY